MDNEKAARRPALLVLVRHAESLRNRAKQDSTYFGDDDARATVRGIPDHKIDLTPEGWEHAVRLGKKIRERFGCFDYIYTSGYLRTNRTREGILAAYTKKERGAMHLRQRIEIRERDPGYTYEMTEEEAERHFPYLRDYWNTFGGFMAVPPGGESIAQMCSRVELFLDMIFRNRGRQKVLIITHGGTLRCFRTLLEHWEYDQAEKWPPSQAPANCGVTTYEFDHSTNRLELREYNSILA
jgi:broad specificity phosphatase PhoE